MERIEINFICTQKKNKTKQNNWGYKQTAADVVVTCNAGLEFTTLAKVG